MRILQIMRCLPYPPSGGTLIRCFNLLQRIATEHDVWLISFANEKEQIEGLPHLKRLCKDIITIQSEKQHAWSKPDLLIKYLFKCRPIELRLYQSDQMKEGIKKLTSMVDFDVVEIIDSKLGEYIEALPASLRSRTIMTFMDVEYIRSKRISEIETEMRKKIRYWLFSQQMRRWEPYYMEQFRSCVTMSENDRSILLQDNPCLSIKVIPNGVDTKKYLPLSTHFQTSTPTLLFVGNMEYAPNIDAMLYFTENIFPRIRQTYDVIDLIIAGKNPPKEILNLEGNCIHVYPDPNVYQYYSRSWVVVVPLRAGSGTRLKILEAMALGRPVVSTSIGCEGLKVTDGENISIADDPNLFAEKVIHHLKMDEFSKIIVNNARKLVVDTYDWDIIAQSTILTYEQIKSESMQKNERET